MTESVSRAPTFDPQPVHPLRESARLLVLLAAAAALLTAFALATVVPLLKPPEEVAKGERLITFDPKQIVALEASVGRRSVRLEKVATGWESLGAAAARDAVPTDRVMEFLETLASTNKLAIVSDEESRWSEFGLDPPRGRLSVTPQGGAAIRIDVGDRNPTLTGLYVAVPPQRAVVLVGAVLLWEAEKILALGPSS